jgi:1-acyl-sn-glycerol-3-phosphate acyltransferase
VPRLEKLRRPGHGEKLGAVWRVVWLVLYAPFSLLIKSRYRNLEGVPQDGPAILIVNHVSHVDPFLVAKMVIDAARTPRFLAKDSIFDVPVVGAAMRGMGHIPVKRGTADARQSLSDAVDALRSGRLIVLHPEGTVTCDPDGWPMIGKTGAARLAMLTPEVPVIPVAQWGVQESIDLYRKRVRLFPRPRHTISVGTPLDLSAVLGGEPTIEVLHQVTDLMMRRLRSDVAELRGVPAPRGALFYWVRPARTDLSDPPAEAESA